MRDLVRFAAPRVDGYLAMARAMAPAEQTV